MDFTSAELFLLVTNAASVVYIYWLRGQRDFERGMFGHVLHDIAKGKAAISFEDGELSVTKKAKVSNEHN